jgi:hypothetical protein
VFNQLLVLKNSPSKRHWIGWSIAFIVSLGAVILLWPSGSTIPWGLLAIFSATDLAFHALRYFVPISPEDACTNCGRRYRGARRQIVGNSPYGQPIIVISVCEECYTHPDRLSPTIVAVNLTRPWGRKLADQAGSLVAQYKKLMSC